MIGFELPRPGMDRWASAGGDKSAAAAIAAAGGMHGWPNKMKRYVCILSVDLRGVGLNSILRP